MGRAHFPPNYCVICTAPPGAVLDGGECLQFSTCRRVLQAGSKETALKATRPESRVIKQQKGMTTGQQGSRISWSHARQQDQQTGQQRTHDTGQKQQDQQTGLQDQEIGQQGHETGPIRQEGAARQPKP